MIPIKRVPILFFTILSIAPLAAYSHGLVAVLPFVFLAALLVRQGRPRPPMPDALLFVSIFSLFAWGLVSALWSDSLRFDKAPALALTAAAGATLLVALRATPERDIKLYARALCGLGGLGSAIFATQFLFDYPLARMVLGPALENGPDGNVAPFAILVFPIAVALFLEFRNKAAAVLFVVLGLILVGLGPMFAATVALCVGAAVFVLAFHFPRTTVALFFALLISYMLAAPWLHRDLITLANLGAHSEVLEYSWSHRLEIWRFASELIAERPLTGIGINGSKAIQTVRTVGGTEFSLMSLHPHNAPLQIWLELGAVGVILAVAICVGLGRLLWRCSGDRLFMGMACASLAATVTIALLSFGIWQTWWQATFWVTAFLVVMMGRRLALERRSAEARPA